MKRIKQFYCIVFFVICLCPLMGMLFVKQEASSENRELAQFPRIKTEEGVNVEWLSLAGDYFQEHFAFRNELVTANALLNGKLLGVSTAEGVIEGTDGWLYYKDSLDDYLGTGLLSERSLYNISHTLSMMQEYLKGRGVDFLFAVAPNKNSLYGEHMPYYNSLKVTEDNNLKRLLPYLEKEGVACADLKEAFLAEEETLYHQRDSHWNNKGAALAADVLLTALGKEHDSYKEEAYTVRSDFEGDLDKMLYPLAIEPEEEIYYDKPVTFAFVGEVESNFDPKITTVNPSKSGSLLMYRDSFGNALLPFMADAYANAYFSRGVPYNLSDVDVHAADTVIVERAERFLPEMAQSPPVLDAQEISLSGDMIENSTDGAMEVRMKTMGPRVQINGRILSGQLDTESEIYLRLNGASAYEAFPMDIRTGTGTDDNGFCLYLPAEKLKSGENTLEILIEKDQKLYKIYQDILKEEPKP